MTDFSSANDPSKTPGVSQTWSSPGVVPLPAAPTPPPPPPIAGWSPPPVPPNVTLSGRVLSPNYAPVEPSLPPPSSGRGATWGFALVVACLLLGFAMSWGWNERRLRLTADQDLRAVSQQSVLGSAERADLGRLMLDSGTKLVPLSAADGATRSEHAAIAWNDQQQRGFLFCDGLAPLPDGQKYQIWLLPTSGTPLKLATLEAEPDKTVYELTATEHTPPANGFEVTAGSGASSAPAGSVRWKGNLP